MALSQPGWEGEPPIHIYVNNGTIPEFGDVVLRTALTSRNLLDNGPITGDSGCARFGAIVSYCPAPELGDDRVIRGGVWRGWGWRSSW